MTFQDYQDEAIQTLIYPGSGTIMGLSYVIMGLCGEAGETAEKVKKIIRDKNGEVSDQDREDLMYEISDVLWYIGASCHELGYSMDEVAKANVEKLRSRKERGKLGGSGDSR